MEDKVLDCPFCHSKRVIPVEIGYYMCGACKRKFSIVDGEVFEVSNTIGKDYDEVDEEIDSFDEDMQSQVDTILKKIKPQKVRKKILTKEQKAKLIKILIISFITIAFIAFAIFGIIVCTEIIPKQRYEEAMSELETDIDSAIYNFESISYSDSENQALLANARKYLLNGNYSDAIINVRRAGGKVNVQFYDSNDKIYEEEITSKTINFIPEKEGYTLNGWSVIEYEFSNNNYHLNLKLNAKWIENK